MTREDYQLIAFGIAVMAANLLAIVVATNLVRAFLL
jgi:hypothetical protein